MRDFIHRDLPNFDLERIGPVKAVRRVSFDQRVRHLDRMRRAEEFEQSNKAAIRTRTMTLALGWLQVRERLYPNAPRNDSSITFTQLGDPDAFLGGQILAAKIPHVLERRFASSSANFWSVCANTPGHARRRCCSGRIARRSHQWSIRMSSMRKTSMPSKRRARGSRPLLAVLARRRPAACRSSCP